MNITEVKIKLMSNRSDRLRAFCSITIDDDFVIRDLRIIEGAKGRFVAMPSRKLTDKCQRCGTKNHLRARFCNNCGFRLEEDRAVAGPQARAKYHVDVAHPINSKCRKRIQDAVLGQFDQELERSRQPGYRPLEDYDSDDDDDDYYGDETGEDTGAASGYADRPASAPPPLTSQHQKSNGHSSFGDGIL